MALGGARPRSSNPRNTHETPTRARNHHRKTLTTSERTRIIGQRSHCANFSSRWPSGRRRTTDGRTTTHKFACRALATGESSRARSFARSHARTQRKRKRNRNRFPGSGVGLKPAPHPQPPIHVKGPPTCSKMPHETPQNTSRGHQIRPGRVLKNK